MQNEGSTLCVASRNLALSNSNATDAAHTKHTEDNKYWRI